MAIKAKHPQSAYLLSILRIVIGFTFCCHGVQKLFGLFGGINGHGAKPALMSLLGVAAILESFGGLLIILGLLTRPVAFILSGEMAVAYFKAHAPHGFWPILNRGELPVVYCFTFLYLAAAGPGPLSLDNLIRRRPTK
jgi:putative oxidoreductase